MFELYFRTPLFSCKKTLFQQGHNNYISLYGKSVSGVKWINKASHIGTKEKIQQTGTRIDSTSFIQKKKKKKGKEKLEQK